MFSWTIQHSQSGKLLLVAATLVLLTLYLVYPNAVPDSRTDQEQDSFTYIFLARSLLAGEGYPTKLWMPGFPVLLAGMLAVVGLAWLPLKLIMIGVSAVTLLVNWRLFRRLIGSPGAFLLTLVLAATPLFFDYSHRLMSEIPYLAASALALLALVEVCSDGLSKGRWIGWGAILVLSSAAAVIIRGNGLALAPALLLGMIVGSGEGSTARRFIIGGALAALFATFGAWTIRCNRLELKDINNADYNNKSYLKEVMTRDPGELLKIGYHNTLWHQVYRTADLLVPSSAQLTEVKKPALGLSLAIVLSLPLLAGFVVLWQRSPPCAAYLLAALLICLIYPSGYAPRMLLPSVPLLLVSAYLGLESMLGKERTWSWFAAVLSVNIVLCTVRADCQSQHPYSREGFADFIGILTQDIPAMAPSGEAVALSFVSDSPYEEAAQALTMRKVMSVHDAMASLTAGQIDSVLLIENASKAQQLPKTLPDGIVDKVLSRRHDVWLLHRSRHNP